MSGEQRDTVYLQIEEERLRQDSKWGEQNWPDGTGSDTYGLLAKISRENCDTKANAGTVTWADILDEEVLEALAEPSGLELREELVQAGAVIVAWIECIDRRGA